ncbi:MAG TPA: hypothetical protein ENL08_01790, partial [Bacteroidetes bacterium]|nr:hypothetical protein [Bacteroidota bacterium]
MKQLHLLNAVIPAILLTFLPLRAGQRSLPESHARVNAENDQRLSVSFDAGDLTMRNLEMRGQQHVEFTLEGEGRLTDAGLPLLPAVSRYVIVPPRSGVRLEVTSCSSVTLNNLPAPQLCPAVSPDGSSSRKVEENDGLYPPQPVVIEGPVIMRGVRMVRITMYPVQYNTTTGDYIRHDRIDLNLRFTDGEAVNPVEFTGQRRGRSPEFVRMLRALAVNADLVSRDEGEIGGDCVGHYLVVAHDSCLQYAIPLIEWKRRCGYKVDILRLTDDEARNVDLIREDIQDIYNDYLDDGLDPFGYILLLGDRPSDDHQDAPWNLYAPEGNTSMPDVADHADYEYTLLEGNDFFPDAAIGRLGSGNRDMMELAVARTLSYEMEPWMEDAGWFDRAGVFSQAWADFNMSIVYTTRWGERILRERGFTDIRIEETDGTNDPNGGIIGPVLADWFNDGMSIMVGRARNQYWEHSFRGVNNNTVFPIYITVNAHGEFTADNMFRTGAIDNLKGPAATIYSWGNPATIFNNAFYLATVSGVLAHDMSLGWARNYAGVSFPRIFQTFEDADLAMRQYQSDTDLYGDPGIKPWIGIPQPVEAAFPATVSPGTDQVEVTVYRENSDDVVRAAQVTLYHPGELPDQADYHDWQPEFMVTGKTDASGKIRLPFDPLIDGGTLYLTVTGRDIYPLLEEIEVVASDLFIAVSDYELDDSAGGNGDGVVNPGETVSLEITAANFGGGETAVDLQARIRSGSPCLSVAEHDPIRFDDLAPGGRGDGDHAVDFTVDPACPDGSEPTLYVDFSSTGFIWSSVITLDIWGTDLEVSEIEGGNLVMNEPRDLNIEIVNRGRIDAPEMTARLVSQGYGIEINRDEVQYPGIAVEERRSSNGNPFRVNVRDLAVPGTTAPMMLVFRRDDVAFDTAFFNLRVNEAQPNAPFGPDDYGYYCYDDSDDGWRLAPRYRWFEISPRTGDQDGDGTRIELFDTVQVNAAEVIALPFKMRFYGREYDTITIGTNGFIGVGDQRRMVNLQNYPVELAIGGPLGMIAPFWTRLYVGGLNRPGVYYYYDDLDQRFIVEWYNVHHENQDENLNFQVIINDPRYHVTLSGDSDILFYYKDIYQTRGPAADMPYASVGISSPDGTAGLSYTYQDTYPAGAAELGRRRAILFTTNLSYTSGATCGRVLDDATDEPLSGAKVRVYADYGIEAVSSDTTGADGEFHMTGLVGLNVDRIEVTRKGYRGVRAEADSMRENDTLDIDLYLLRPRIWLNRNEVGEFLVPGHRTSHHVGIQNSGTGPLEYIVSLGDPIEDEGSGIDREGVDRWKDCRRQVCFTSWLSI